MREQISHKAYKKLLKRFLKDRGLFGMYSYLYKLMYDRLNIRTDSMPFVALLPFDLFRWNDTEQGHTFWYNISIEWAIVYTNFLLSYDKDDKVVFTTPMNKLEGCLRYLLNCFTDVNKEITKLESYKQLKELFNKRFGDVEVFATFS